VFGFWFLLYFGDVSLEESYLQLVVQFVTMIVCFVFRRRRSSGFRPPKELAEHFRSVCCFFALFDLIYTSVKLVMNGMTMVDMMMKVFAVRHF